MLTAADATADVAAAVRRHLFAALLLSPRVSSWLAGRDCGGGDGAGTVAAAVSAQFVLVEKSPENVFRHAFLRAALGEAARFVLIRRSMAAVATSISRFSSDAWYGWDDVKWRCISAASAALPLPSASSHVSRVVPTLSPVVGSHHAAASRPLPSQPLPFQPARLHGDQWIALLWCVRTRAAHPHCATHAAYALSPPAAYQNLTSYMQQRAASEGGVPFPSAFYLDIYSFDNILESGDTK